MDRRASLLSDAIVLIKAGYQIADVILDLRSRHADQGSLDIVPELSHLHLHRAMTTHGRVHDATGQWRTT